MLAGAILAGGACGGQTASREPKQHRSKPVTCDSTRDPTPPSGFPVDPSVSTCATDSDCTDGKNGRCTPMRGLASCTYDECFTDADCANRVATNTDQRSGSAVCSCGMGYGNNTCLEPGNCLTDADCGGGYCSPSFGTCGNYLGVTTYYCHTSRDRCVDDADCGSMGAYCAYSPMEGLWSCSTSECAG